MGTLAPRRGRDVKGVHTATQALVLGGVIDKTTAGKLLFPYDAVGEGWRACCKSQDVGLGYRV
mgnify:CR=1 FL=1